MKTIIFRPSVEREGSFMTKQLEEAFSTMCLINATSCEDRIVYVFGKADPDVGRTSNSPNSL